MNYIRELNAFRDWLILNDLATSEVALWYTLMSVDNMTGWQEWFTVPNSTLQQLAKLSKQGLDNARSALKAKGLIDYKKGSRKQCGSYRITSLVNSFDQLLDRKIDQSLDPSLDRKVYQSLDQHLPIIKEELIPKTKEIYPYPDDAKERLRKYLNTCKITGAGIDGLDTVYSYLGQVEIEVIEKALAKSENMPINYFVKVINGFMLEGKKTAESINTIPKGGDPPNGRTQQGNPGNDIPPDQQSLTARFTKPDG